MRKIHQRRPGVQPVEAGHRGEGGPARSGREGGGVAHRRPGRAPMPSSTAAVRRAGVLRVTTIPDLFNMAEILAMQPPPRGPAWRIVTNAGGPGVMATDALMLGGGQLAPLSQARWTRSTQFCRRSGATAIRSTCSATPRPSAIELAVEILRQGSERAGRA